MLDGENLTGPDGLTGTVKITEWTSMGSGEMTLEPTLSMCSAVVAPRAKGK